MKMDWIVSRHPMQHDPPGLRVAHQSGRTVSSLCDTARRLRPGCEAVSWPFACRRITDSSAALRAYKSINYCAGTNSISNSDSETTGRL